MTVFCKECGTAGGQRRPSLRRVARNAVRRADVGIGSYGGLKGVQQNGPSGKSAKRRQWRKKRADFEEVPRLAATTVAGNRLARRWATAAPYGRIIGGVVGRADVGIGPYGGLQGVQQNGPSGTPAPTGGLQEVCGAGDREGRPYGGVARGAGRAESPSHGFAVPAPLGKGAEGTGENRGFLTR